MSLSSGIDSRDITFAGYNSIVFGATRARLRCKDYRAKTQLQLVKASSIIQSVELDCGLDDTGAASFIDGGGSARGAAECERGGTEAKSLRSLPEVGVAVRC